MLEQINFRITEKIKFLNKDNILGVLGVFNLKSTINFKCQATIDYDKIPSIKHTCQELFDFAKIEAENISILSKLFMLKTDQIIM